MLFLSKFFSKITDMVVQNLPDPQVPEFLKSIYNVRENILS